MASTSQSESLRPPAARLCKRCNLIEVIFDEVASRPLSHETDPAVHIWDKIVHVFKLIDSWPSLVTLTASASDGCALCRRLRDDIAKRYKNPDVDEVSMRLRGCMLEGKLVALDCVITAPKDFEQGLGGPPFLLRYYASSEDSVPHPRLFKAPEIDTLSEKNIQFIRRSIERCQPDYHVEQLGGATRSLPKRLLDLGPPGPKSFVKLVESNSLAFENSTCDPRYAAVSYCWGTQPQAMTTPQNIESRLQEIPLEDMSAVAHDAVILCRILSIRYLWIDALCILQGPSLEANDDWQTQSESMDEVFSLAYITICAANAPSSQVSFLHRPPIPRLVIPLGTRPSLQSKSSPTPFRRLPDHLELTGSTSSRYSLKDPYDVDYAWSKWHMRGWVHQERELSSRLLIFGQNLVHFQAGKYRACENGWEAGHNLHTERATLSECSSGSLPPPAREDGHKDPQTHREYFEGFRYSVSRYSWKDLTFEKDRLPGLAGLARRLHKLTGSQYHAGLWEDTLHIDLLFVTERLFKDRENPQPHTKTDTICATPSWSWANKTPHSNILWHLPDVAAKSEFVRCQASVVLKGHSMFGEVKSGQLDLRTHVLAPDKRFELIHSGPEASRWPKYVLCQENGPRIGEVFLDEIGAISMHTSWDPASFDCKGVALALISSDAKRSGTGYGLVLRMSEILNKYHRVGVFRSEETIGGSLLYCKSWPLQDIEVI